MTKREILIKKRLQYEKKIQKVETSKNQLRSKYYGYREISEREIIFNIKVTMLMKNH